ncbi:MAG TPA: sugar ABC transporter substrate-binding protein [Halanaerobiales bacterium]|nr:sugar ABC transporter substrate-binding protein [Halanaerobiales bacterium]
MQLKPTFTDYINGVISDFEEQNPDVKVKWVDVPWADMEKKILSATAANNAPDVANLNVPFSMKLAELDALVDMDSNLDQETIDKYFPTVWEANTFEGETHAIPWYLSTSLTMYNTEIFKEAGLDPNNPPQYYDELLEMGRTVKEETVKYLLFPPIAETGRYLEYMVREGIPLTNEDGTAAFNTEKSVELLQMWTTMYEEGIIPEETVTEGHNAAVDVYQSGQAAILLTGPQFLSRIEENAPEVFEVTEVAPEISGNADRVGVAVMNIAVLEQTEHKQAALDFAAFITNNKNQLDFAKIVNILPSTKEAAQDPYFTDVDEGSVKDRAKKVSAQQLDRATNLVPPMENQGELNEVINQMVQNALLGEKTPAEALNDAEAEWNNIVNN